MEERPDWVEMVEAARAGDRAAQGALLARFDPLARSTASRLVDADRVDDVVQQTWAVALETLPRLRTAEAFPSWLRLIVRKQASRVRDERRTDRLDSSVDPTDPHGDPAEHAARAEVAAVVRMALAAAGDQDRRLLELRYLAGWSNDELAQLLGVSAGTLRKRLHDARRRLRPSLEHLNPKETLVTDYRRFLTTVHDPAVDVPAPPSLRPPSAERTVTGLKVIDALAPVRRGGTIEMVGPSGAGHLVLVFELLYRLGRTEHGVACVGVGQTGRSIGSQPDLSCVVTEPGVPGPNAAVMWSDPADIKRAFAAASRVAAGLAADGLDVIVAVDRPSLAALEPSDLTGAAGKAREGAVTVVAVNALDRDAEPCEPLGLDTTLVFSVEHLALGIYPAIDGAQSTSVLELTEQGAAAKRALADAATLRAWFDQPMYMAQDYTGEDGTWLEPDALAEELTSRRSVHVP